MKQKRLLFLLVLLLTATTGAWADDWTDIVKNSDMEGTDVSCYYVKENGKGSENLYIAHITAANGNKHSDGDWLDSFQTISFSLAMKAKEPDAEAIEFIFDNIKVEIPSDVLTTLTPEPVTDPMLMIPYHDDDDVAVGKLKAAIKTYDAIASPTADDKATLKAAIDQFKADNADQEKDETAKVNTAGWKTFNGSDAALAPDWAASAVNTYDKRSTQPAEVYEGSADGVNRTGIIIYQDITGLANGQYKVGFYGTAYYTNGRGFESTMEDGSTDVAYVFANEQKKFITARVGTSFSEYNLLQFNVTVTDGNIKLGLGKEKGGSNWHTMQIYQLTWFATAKEAYAASQTELKALLTDAKALAADENKTEGKNDFNAVIATAEEATTTKADWYNNTEIEAIIADLKTAIANFKKANWFIDFAAGQYYLIDVETQKLMAAGHDWGTRGILNEAGLDLTLTPNSETRTVTIDSRVFNGDTKHFLDSNLYMDGSAYGWALEYQGFGFYILDPASEKYINIDANNNLELSSTPREWIIVTADGVMEQLLNDMDNATEENPVDATRLIKANNFNRNDARNEAWTMEQTLTGEGHTTNISGGEDNNNGSVGNNCAEAYCTPFSFTQTITGAPAGVYQLTAQGFYEGSGDVPTFFANSVTGNVHAKTGSEGNMTQAAQSFSAGKYTIEPIEFQVKDDGQIVLGVSGTSDSQWVIFDNFRLTYLGVRELGVKLAAGTEDAENWTLSDGTTTVTGSKKLAPVAEGTTVTLKYNGRLKVKGVKATSDAAPAANIVDLSKLTENTELQDGDVVKGTLNGAQKITIADGATVTLDGVTINGEHSDWYLYAGITCLGDATIILKDGTTNTVTGFDGAFPGIQGAAGKTLTITGTGSLYASCDVNGSGAGIGSASYSNNKPERACGNIVIEGGTITAVGGYSGAGIGSGNTASCGNITIKSTVAHVTATKGKGAPDSIGAGKNGSCGTKTIEDASKVTENSQK